MERKRAPKVGWRMGVLKWNIGFSAVSSGLFDHDRFSRRAEILDILELGEKTGKRSLKKAYRMKRARAPCG
jgi:hypothetical protein